MGKQPKAAVEGMRKFKRFIVCDAMEFCRGGCGPFTPAEYVVALESKDGDLGISSLCGRCVIAMREASEEAGVVEEVSNPKGGAE